MSRSNREHATFAQNRKTMKEMFDQDLTEKEQVNNMLTSCSDWCTTRSSTPMFRFYSGLLADYGFSLQEVRRSYNELVDENTKLKQRIQDLKDGVA